MFKSDLQNRGVTGQDTENASFPSLVGAVASAVQAVNVCFSFLIYALCHPRVVSASSSSFSSIHIHLSTDHKPTGHAPTKRRTDIETDSSRGSQKAY